ncbi:hypothetical protein ONZ45_g13577 [Pleurotus djamor]|nr:hypothetical protein ONZ45_g13577 [Pleurotus djamor]
MTAANSPILTTTDVTTVPDADVPAHDPPPPYPSGRTRRSRQANRQSRVAHTQIASADSQHSEQDATLTSPLRTASYQFPTADDDDDATESTPFLSPTSPTTRRGMNRQRSFSHTSTVLSTASGAPSLAHTLLSLFQADEEEDTGSEEGREEEEEERSGTLLLMAEESSRSSTQDRTSASFFSRKGLAKYFRPMGRSVYYGSLLHLVVLNFPYALVAWIYLFVFTLTGTTLLVALPLGAALCFLDLLGARAFARGELALQTRFHKPLAFPPPHPPRPIFTRFREITLDEAEAANAQTAYVTRL